MDDAMISVERMTRDIRAAAMTLTAREARFLVDAYYQMQEDRLRAASRVDRMEESGEPHATISWLNAQSSTLEQQIKGALDRYSGAHPVGIWARSIKGIGPVLSAGYLANLDITRAPTAGHFWAACGLVPGRDRRKRGVKIEGMWNPALKRLAFLTGESFKRLSPDDEDAFYRRIYDKRKAYEVAKNEAGDYADQAAAALKEKDYGKDTKALTFYAAGKLPPAHIDRRAARYAAKLFLAHLHEVWWRHEHGTAPPYPYPMPYAVAHMGHGHKINPPQMPDAPTS